MTSPFQAIGRNAILIHLTPRSGLFYFNVITEPTLESFGHYQVKVKLTFHTENVDHDYGYYDTTAVAEEEGDEEVEEGVNWQNVVERSEYY